MNEQPFYIARWSDHKLCGNITYHRYPDLHILCGRVLVIHPTPVDAFVLEKVYTVHGVDTDCTSTNTSSTSTSVRGALVVHLADLTIIPLD